LSPTSLQLAQQRLRDVARAVGDGEHLAAGLFLESHAEPLEEIDGFFDWERAQYAPDNGSFAAPEILFGHDGIGDVAPATAADDDFGAWQPRAVEHRNANVPVRASQENRRGQSGGSGADDREIHLSRHSAIMRFSVSRGFRLRPEGSSA